MIFKKYSPMGELASFAAQICESLNKATDCVTAVCDRDTVIAVSGGARRELQDKRVSPELERIMEGRKLYKYEQGGEYEPALEGEDRHSIVVAAPILSEGDVLGCVMFVSQKNGVPSGEIEVKLAQTVAGFLGRQMES